MSDYKMVPVVATEEMVGEFLRYSAWGLTDAAYQAMLAKAPPFVATDEMVEKACAAYKAACESDFIAEGGPMRAAIEAVLGGGK